MDVVVIYHVTVVACTHYTGVVEEFGLIIIGCVLRTETMQNRFLNKNYSIFTSPWPRVGTGLAYHVIQRYDTIKLLLLFHFSDELTAAEVAILKF